MFLNKNLAARRIFVALYEDPNKVPVQHSKIGASKRYGVIKQQLRLFLLTLQGDYIPLGTVVSLFLKIVRRLPCITKLPLLAG
jgi:hypothetical protein